MGDNRAWMYDQWDKPPGFCLKEQFTDGLEGFMEFAAANTPPLCFLRCPCSICKNKKFKEEDEVKHHILRKVFMPNYYTRTCHGETMAVNNRERVDVEVNPNQPTRRENNFVGMIYDIAGPSFRAPINEASESEELNPKAKAFYELLKKSAKPISEGSLDSIMSITSKALTLKSKHNGSQQMFSDMMDVFRPNMAGGDDLPRNFYQAKKLVGALGLPRERIDVCLNVCTLYWKEYSNLIECKYFKHPRWKTKTQKDKTQSQKNRGKNVPFKRLYYLPLIQRLQRVCASSETAKHMKWHAEWSSASGTMCHPSDSEAWKVFDAQWKEFYFDPRNVRLGLCTNGFQPFGKAGKKFLCWPVIVTPYNLPP